VVTAVAVVGAANDTLTAKLIVATGSTRVGRRGIR
jgi:hypothetical protein